MQLKECFGRPKLEGGVGVEIITFKHWGTGKKIVMNLFETITFLMYHPYQVSAERCHD